MNRTNVSRFECFRLGAFQPLSVTGGFPVGIGSGANNHARGVRRTKEPKLEGDHADP
jgi:hypothetical protein